MSTINRNKFFSFKREYFCKYIWTFLTGFHFKCFKKNFDMIIIRVVLKKIKFTVKCLHANRIGVVRSSFKEKCQRPIAGCFCCIFLVKIPLKLLRSGHVSGNSNISRREGTCIYYTFSGIFRISLTKNDLVLSTWIFFNKLVIILLVQTLDLHVH